tara:strand:+ start:787 stop:969 length:183 start_codon:yes stop_codon:yes gene_type:complete
MEGIFMKIIKFFTLKVYQDGIVRKCSFRERIDWVLKGCPLRDKKVVERAIRMAHNNRATS